MPNKGGLYRFVEILLYISFLVVQRQIVMAKKLQRYMEELKAALSNGKEDTAIAILNSGVKLDSESFDLALESNLLIVAERILKDPEFVPTSDHFETCIREDELKDLAYSILGHPKFVPGTESLNYVLENGIENLAKRFLEKGAKPNSRSLELALKKGFFLFLNKLCLVKIMKVFLCQTPFFIVQVKVSL